MNNIFNRTVIFAAAAALCGCMVGPDFEKPASDMSGEYSNKSGGKILTDAEKTEGMSEAELAQWWNVFGDDVLTSLIERAFKGNLTIASAMAKINQARSTLGISQSGFFPGLDASGGFSEGGATIDAARPTYSLGASSSWEIDVFGGTRRGIESAAETYRAALADKCAARIAVAAEVAQNYFQYRAYQQELLITKSNLETQKKTFSITQQRKANGFVSELDVVRAAAEVESTSAKIPQLERDMVLTRHAIEFLLGDKTGALTKELAAPKDLPELEKFIPVGVPAQLVKRRPDIIVAEHKLHSAIAKIGLARADYYPKFYITGQVSYQAPEIGDIVQNQYGSWSVGPSFKWNLFQAGKTVYNVKLQEAISEEAGVSWNSAVLTALKEVEDSIVKSAKERERIYFINRLVENNRRAFQLSTRLYSEGEIEFLDLLDTQRSMLSSEINQIESRQLFISNVITLYKSLGGGWSPQDMKDDPEKTEYLFFKDSFQPTDKKESAN